MKLPELKHGKLLKRYKRFLSDIILDDGSIITAHVPNSGAMTSCIEENCDVWVSQNNNPKRKLSYTLELSHLGYGFIGVNTIYANKIAVEAIKNNLISELRGYKTIKTEQKYGLNSRIDILLENENEKCYVEVKSVTLRQESCLAFPDSITKRGTKHLLELINMKKQGFRSVMFFLAQRNDLDIFKIANSIDPVYAKTLTEAKNLGVELLAYNSYVNTNEIIISKPMDFMKNEKD